MKLHDIAQTTVGFVPDSLDGPDFLWCTND